MTLAEITTNVKVWLGQHPIATTTLIEAIANDELVALMKAFFFDNMDFEEDVDCVADTAYISLVTNTTAFDIRSVYDEDNMYELVQKDDGWYNTLSDPDTSGTPDYWVFRLNKIYLYPVPSAIITYRIRGLKGPATLTSGQTPGIPSEWHYILECKTASRIAASLKLNDIMMNARNEALSKISELTEPRTFRRRGRTSQITVERKRP